MEAKCNYHWKRMWTRIMKGVELSNGTYVINLAEKSDDFMVRENAQHGEIQP